VAVEIAKEIFFSTCPQPIIFTNSEGSTAT